MFAHILTLFILFLGYFVLSNSRCSNNRKRLCYINYACSILILQSGLRNVAVGPDTYAYFVEFEYILQKSWAEIYENFHTVYILGEGKDAGYPLLLKTFHLFSSNYTIYLLFVAVVFFSALRKLLIQYTNSISDVFFAVILYLALFYSFYSITGIRQTLAVALSVHALVFIKKKYVSYFVICCVIAFSIHKSAAIMPLLYFLYYYRNINKTMLFVSVGFIIFGVFREYFVELLRDAAKYEFFVAETPWKIMAFYFIFSLLIYWKIRKINPKDDIRGIFTMFIPTFMWIPVLGNDSIFMREVLYFAIYIIPLLPFALAGNKKQNSFLLIIRLFLLILLLYIYLQASEYKFFWQDMKLPSNYY